MRTREVAITLVALTIGVQAWGIVSNVNNHDPQGDYEEVLVTSFGCNPYEMPFTNSGPLHQRNQLKWWLNCISYHAFSGNVKVIPILFNIGIMPLTYLIASRLTNDRLIGLIALVALINNPLYSDWKNSGTYDQVWSFLLLFSVYMMFWSRLGMIPFLGSLTAKMLGLFYFPAWLYTNYKLRRDPLEIIISICVIAIAFLAIGIITKWHVVGAAVGFFPERWEDAVFRNISVLWQIIPFAVFVVASRSFMPKNRVKNTSIIWVWILCALIQNPLIYIFTLQDTYSYRYVPLAAFMSVFVGTTLVNMGNWFIETRLAKSLKT